MNGLKLETPGVITWQTLPQYQSLEKDEVKIQVLYGGICGSDIAVYKGRLPHALYPVVPGHEILGRVVEVGSDVSIPVGTKVVVHPNTYCDDCHQCKKGKTNLCQNKESLGINVHGGFKEELVINEKYVIEVPEQLDDKRAILIEPLAVIVHALKKVEITKETSIAIIGCGTEGFLTIALAHYFGAKITAIDINEDKLKEVQKLHTNIDVKLPHQVYSDQYDVVVEVAGVEQSFKQAIDIVKPGGTIIAIGFPELVAIPIVKVVREEITIKGSIIYNARDDFKESIRYLLDHNFKVDPIISDVIPISDYQNAYEKAASGKHRKIVLKF